MSGNLVEVEADERDDGDNGDEKGDGTHRGKKISALIFSIKIET